jgi:hypothetical protein
VATGAASESADSGMQSRLGKVTLLELDCLPFHLQDEVGLIGCGKQASDLPLKRSPLTSVLTVERALAYTGVSLNTTLKQWNEPFDSDKRISPAQMPRKITINKYSRRLSNGSARTAQHDESTTGQYTQQGSPRLPIYSGCTRYQHAVQAQRPDLRGSAGKRSLPQPTSPVPPRLAKSTQFPMAMPPPGEQAPPPVQPPSPYYPAGLQVPGQPGQQSHTTSPGAPPQSAHTQYAQQYPGTQQQYYGAPQQHHGAPQQYHGAPQQ